MAVEQLQAGDAGRAGAVDDQLECSRCSRPVSSSALSSPAAAMMAVPCWSSWKTGMFEQLLELLLDDEAVRRLDVLQVDAAEAGPR